MNATTPEPIRPTVLAPTVLAIGGSDCAGMAGIQADGRAIVALGAHPATVVTAVTAQNSRTVLGVNPVPDEVLEQQLQACLALDPAAIKIGLLATADQVRICARFIRQRRADSTTPVVLDPVLASSSGQSLVEPEVEAALRDELLSLCTLVTPNRDEAARLSGLPLAHLEDVADVVARLRAASDSAVLLKGGHWEGATSSDFLASGKQQFWLASPRQSTANRRGTGCTLASAIAAALALGYSLADAVIIGKMAVNQGLRQSYAPSGQGADPQSAPDVAQQGPLRPTHFPDTGTDLPVLSEAPLATVERPAFPDCGNAPLGLYPVVDRAAWLETLLPAGVTTVQLRVKDLEGEALREEIRRAIAIAERQGARLFINDHWQLAIELGAYGVHLGQEDLDDADVDAIRSAGLRLGISTHCHYEVASAVRWRPSYLACGPVYATATKDMPWIPHGPAGFAYWRRVLADYPLVAIGGIHRDRLEAVQATGPDGIAMITAITHAPDPAATAAEFMALMATATDDVGQDTGRATGRPTVSMDSQAQRQPVARSRS